jgi:hypothetical protein
MALTCCKEGRARLSRGAALAPSLSASPITAILARNLDSLLLDLRLVSGFTIGLRTLGDGRGFEDSTLILGRILNNRYGLDAHAATATAWNTSIRYYDGHFACGTGINPALDRFGVRFSRGAADAYNWTCRVFVPLQLLI